MKKHIHQKNEEAPADETQHIADAIQDVAAWRGGKFSRRHAQLLMKAITKLIYQLVE